MTNIEMDLNNDHLLEKKKSEMIFQYMLVQSRNLSELGTMQGGLAKPIHVYKSAVKGVEEFLKLENNRIQTALQESVKFRNSLTMKEE